MRTRVVLAALAATVLLPHPSARAEIGCVSGRFSLKRDGITYVGGSTRAGQPCQIAFGVAGSNIEALQTVVKPTHGVLGASAKENNRRYIAYAPSPGFVGRDRFEVYVQFMPVGGGSFATTVKVEMNITP